MSRNEFWLQGLGVTVWAAIVGAALVYAIPADAKSAKAKAFEANASDVEQPPAHFFDRPAPAITVRPSSNTEIANACNVPATMGWGGCAVPDGGGCTILINKGYTPGSVRYMAMLRHEMGHCFGWRH